jgi:hypothetical protein
MTEGLYDNDGICAMMKEVSFYTTICNSLIFLGILLYHLLNSSIYLVIFFMDT